MTPILPPSRSRSGAPRLSLLAAHLIAVCVPLLHTWSHGHDTAHPSPPGGEVGEEHHEVHPAALHDDWVVVDRATVDVAFAVPATALPPYEPREIDHLPPRHIPSAGSRAPPGGDVARSPPIA